MSMLIPLVARGLVARGIVSEGAASAGSTFAKGVAKGWKRQSKDYAKSERGQHAQSALSGAQYRSASPPGKRVMETPSGTPTQQDSGPGAPPPWWRVGGSR